MPCLRLFASFALALFALTCASGRPTHRRVEPVPARPAPGAWNNEWSRGAVFYEAFVRSFADSDGDGIGDIRGLTAKLDYLNDGRPETTDDLGVDAIWLMPVFASPSYHGYDTTDYDVINPAYGSNTEFLNFLDEAHRRGIRVIVDYVVNHTSSQHPWFLESASSPTSARRDWYVWSDSDRGWTQPWGGNGRTWHEKNGAYYYGLFWSGMPDLNFRTPAVRETVKQTASLWLDRGLDGFRLDATRHLVEDGPGSGQSDTPETHAFLKEFAAHVKRAKPEATLIGENWTDTPVIATYYGSPSVPGGDELPMSFDFPLAEETVKGIARGDATGIAAKLVEVTRLYPAGAIDAPFLTNHDQVRLATQLGRTPAKLRNAAAVLLTLPGAPFIYYGEEVGLQNGPTSGDESKRTPMPWDDATAGGGFTTGKPWFAFAPGRDDANVAAQTRDPGSLLSRYRDLIRVRKSSVALTKGGIEVLTPVTGSNAVLAFVRTYGTERVLVVHNLSDTFLAAGPYAVTASGYEKLFADAEVGDPSGGPGAVQVTLLPRATGAWRLR